MADEGDSGEKTEKPTSRRRGQAREQGMVAKSNDLIQVLTMTTAFLLLCRLAPAMWGKQIVLFRAALTSDLSTHDMSIDELRLHFVNVILFLIPEVGMMLLATAFVGSLATMIQTNFLFSKKLLKPRLNMINPMAGFKRILSVQNVFQIFKQLARLAIIAPIAYFGFMEVFPQFFALMSIPITDLIPFAGTVVSLIFWRIMKLLFVLALLDYAWQKYRTAKQLKMSKHEIKDETKATEGDEKTKLRIRARALQRVRQRMLQGVKKADVVVTNPTHYAVALSYSAVPGSAPVVVAKGKNHLAQRIKEIAREFNVPVIERKPLARALFADVEVGNEIPYELYAAVAELLAYVFRIKGRNPLAKKRAQEAQAQTGRR